MNTPAAYGDYADKHYKVLNDIDLSGYISGTGWIPVGSDSTQPFKGILDGNGKKISGLYINDSAYVDIGRYGLFGEVVSATITDLDIVGADITAPQYAGVLAGNISESTVTGCNATGMVTVTGTIGGGLIGSVLNSSLENCSANVNVMVQDNAGGLAGYARDAEILNCSAAGDVSGGDNVGGVAGYADCTDVKNCYATGNVNGNSNDNNSWYAGGVVGYAENANILSCYATGAIFGFGSVGGVAGSIVSVGFVDCVVKDCAALNSSVGGTGSSVGRVIGYKNGISTATDNVAWGAMSNSGSAPFSSAPGLGGTNITATEITGDGTIGGRFTAVGGWTTANGKLPGLFGNTVGMPSWLVD